MDLASFYIIAVGAMLLCVWWSGYHVLQKLGLLLLLAWATTNVVVATYGFERAPLYIATIHAGIACGIAWVGATNKSVTALVVFGLYALMAVVDIVALGTHEEATYGYYATLNIIFLAQLLFVGGNGAWLAARYSVHPRYQRRSHHLLRR